MIYDDEKFNAMPIHEGCVNCWDLINNRFELIEDNNIDIDSIEEVNENMRFTDYVIEDRYLRKKINDTVQAVKQLNREIKELKER